VPLDEIIEGVAVGNIDNGGIDRACVILTKLPRFSVSDAGAAPGGGTQARLAPLSPDDTSVSAVAIGVDIVAQHRMFSSPQ
jgi:hypothetical protein